MSRTSPITLWYQNIHWLPLKRTFLAVVSDAQSLLVSVLLLVLLYNCQYKSYICPTQHIHSLCHSKVYTLLVGLLQIKQLTVYTAQVETSKLTDGDRSQQEEGRLYWWGKKVDSLFVYQALAPGDVTFSMDCLMSWPSLSDMRPILSDTLVMPSARLSGRAFTALDTFLMELLRGFTNVSIWWVHKTKREIVFYQTGHWLVVCKVQHISVIMNMHSYVLHTRITMVHVTYLHLFGSELMRWTLRANSPLPLL